MMSDETNLVPHVEDALSCCNEHAGDYLRVVFRPRHFELHPRARAYGFTPSRTRSEERARFSESVENST